jgi:hypothetical protein
MLGLSAADVEDAPRVTDYPEKVGTGNCKLRKLPVPSRLAFLLGLSAADVEDAPRVTDYPEKVHCCTGNV